MRNIGRKHLVALAAVLMLGGGPVGTPAQAGEPQRYTFSEVQMGAPWRITLYASSENTANQAAKAAYARVAELNRVLSDYDAESELSRLSKTAGTATPVKISADLWNVLERSQQLAEKTDGAFDVTVGPLTRLWRRARRQKEMPRAELLEAAREATGFQSLRLDPERRTAELLKPNMRLDPGGIGMGYAVDEAIKVLKCDGITSAMIDASGDIGTLDAPPGKPGWKIGIAPLSGDGPPSRYVWLANLALTNSGDAFQAVEIDGTRYSHIVDPRTGLGLTHRSSVTVIAPDCTTADSYATAVSVLGPSAGMKLIGATPDTETLIVQQDDSGMTTTCESAGFKRFVAEQ